MGLIMFIGKDVVIGRFLGVGGSDRGYRLGCLG